MTFLVNRLNDCAREARREAEKQEGRKALRLTRLAETLEATARSLPQEVD